MENISQNNTEGQTPPIKTVNYFCNHFSPGEVRKLLHMMIRSAFAQEKLLDKREVLELLFLKEELVTLIAAAEELASYKANKSVLKKIFRKKKASEWIEWLDELFHSALYEGFIFSSANDDDVYCSCRGLFKLVKACYFIHERAKEHKHAGAQG